MVATCKLISSRVNGFKALNAGVDGYVDPPRTGITDEI